MNPFPVSARKAQDLLRRMERLGVREADLNEKFVKGGGPGGQKINKTSSCVFLAHRASGVEIKCQWDRSQAMNRFLARRELCDRLESIREARRSARQQEHERIRRQKRRRSRRQKERMLADKRRQAGKKRLRRKESPADDS